MTVTVSVGCASGAVRVPTSKSVAHRALFLAAFADGVTTLDNLPDGEDIAATLRVLAALGVEMKKEGNHLSVVGKKTSDVMAVDRVIDCGESGTTLRFALPICLALGGRTTFVGAPRLFERPMQVYEELCRRQGIKYKKEEGSLSVSGKLSAGAFELRGDVSSQFVSGLLLAAPLLCGDSTVRLTAPLVSAPYVALTCRTMAAFGVHVSPLSDGYAVSPSRPAACRFTVPVDASSAAVFGALRALDNDVTIENDSPDPLQADDVFRTLFSLVLREKSTVSVADCPDLAPLLAVLGALGQGIRLTGTARLRDKESDRAAAMKAELEKCGVSVHLGADYLTVSGGAQAPAAFLDSHNDHRIAMALAVLLTRVGGTLTDAQSVKKSFPDFWKRLQDVGVSVIKEGDG